jgi:hypothetical protein
MRRVHGAKVIESTIERLTLHEAFGGVVLASRLVNVPDARQRQGLLSACRRHVARRDGYVIIERWTPEQASSLRVDDLRFVDGVEIRARSIERDGDRLRVDLGYRIDGQQWVQIFRGGRPWRWRIRGRAPLRGSRPSALAQRRAHVESRRSNMSQRGRNASRAANDHRSRATASLR